MPHTPIRSHVERPARPCSPTTTIMPQFSNQVISLSSSIYQKRTAPDQVPRLCPVYVMQQLTAIVLPFAGRPIDREGSHRV